MRKIIYILVLIITIVQLSGCMQAPPRHVESICKIFKQYPDWYWATTTTKKRWGLPISTQMAIIYEESRFHADAKPPREKLLWIIPWSRPTTAYGYSQALNGTWRHYRNNTGKRGSRDAFADASDFIGWYAAQIHNMTGISMYNTYAIYLAYHEGVGGYVRGTYRRKPWLTGVARKVAYRATVYSSQLIACRNSLPTKPWWRTW